MLDDRVRNIIAYRNNNTLIPNLEKDMPLDVEEAYLFQEEVVKSLNFNSIGWKVGCTTEMAQKFSGMSEPFLG